MFCSRFYDDAFDDGHIRKAWEDDSERLLSGFVQTLENPEIKVLKFPGLESHGKGIGHGKPWETPGILKQWSWKFYFLVQVSLPREEINCNTSCAFCHI